MAAMRYEQERQAVVDFAKRMTSDGLVVGTSGNISQRMGDHVVVTPSGTDYSTMTARDIVVVDIEGSTVEGDLRPTVELPIHLACYRELGACAVVHTHSRAATALSLLRDDVPKVHYQIAMFGGSVRVAPYATYGTQELVANVTAALHDRTACIMKHHGSIAIGENLAKTYDRVRQLEWLCEVWMTAAAIGDPAVLSDGEIEHVTQKFASYGQPRPV